MGLAAIEPTHRLALAVSATLARGSNLSPGDATNLTALAGLARDAATGAALAAREYTPANPWFCPTALTSASSTHRLGK